jgi:hypothetical protein
VRSHWTGLIPTLGFGVMCRFRKVYTAQKYCRGACKVHGAAGIWTSDDVENTQCFLQTAIRPFFFWLGDQRRMDERQRVPALSIRYYWAVLVLTDYE